MRTKDTRIDAYIEYLEWIVVAKTDATRERRMATAVEWLGEGRSMNWKCERRTPTRETRSR